jgi:hypothetical protein
MPTTHLHLTALPPRVTKNEHTWRGDALSIEQSREIVQLIRRRPWQGDTTVVHITNAHLVRDDVWNTLLKSLEEPPPYVQFHLYAPSTDAIPRTIRSRSHITRESLPNFIPEDASRLARLFEGGDALAILRECDRHTETEETRRLVRSLWAYCIETGRLDAGVLCDYYLGKLQNGVSPRIVLKALLLTLAVRHKMAVTSAA